ncbi:hypothetical protein B0T26DRAFT_717704 [Lasiosphaeria miniovina]|uniref:Uncharacterized protein n=1 Tax=Lasiosphaeria miniovina TaxID=1954250 RepID=A0AA40ACU5_9PEZI|nr:uncharacterized protein B0T26DRAFT_717704 [Lasiosphaeria miniovina]KAK0713536.1 hypothetical protein B0T26DRAFT_717704 [Lasiosphaeria miniovina]
MFYISPAKLAQLQADVAADPAIAALPSSRGPSSSDIIQALFWGAAICARYAAITGHHGQPIPRDAPSILEQAVDGHPYFSPLLPGSYTGNLLVFNRLALPADEPVSSASVTDVARTVRTCAAQVRPQLSHDALATIREPVADYSAVKFALTRHDSMDMMMTTSCCSRRARCWRLEPGCLAVRAASHGLRSAGRRR